MCENIINMAVNIYKNAYSASCAIEAYMAIGESVDQLNCNDKHFWGFVQKTMFNIIILEICKIYDQSSPRNKKNTIIEILELVNEHLEKIENQRKNPTGESIKEPNFSNVFARDVNSFYNQSDFKKKCKSNVLNIEDFMSEAQSRTKAIIESPEFKVCKTYRDKRLAHHDQSNNDIPKDLPSLNKMLEFITFAKELSILINNLFSSESSLVDSPPRIKHRMKQMFQTLSN